MIAPREFSLVYCHYKYVNNLPQQKNPLLCKDPFIGHRHSAGTPLFTWMYSAKAQAWMENNRSGGNLAAPPRDRNWHRTHFWKLKRATKKIWRIWSIEKDHKEKCADDLHMCPFTYVLIWTHTSYPYSVAGREAASFWESTRVPGIRAKLKERSQSAYAPPAPKPVEKAIGHIRPKLSIPVEPRDMWRHTTEKDHRGNNSYAKTNTTLPNVRMLCSWERSQDHDPRFYEQLRHFEVRLVEMN